MAVYISIKAIQSFIKALYCSVNLAFQISPDK